LLLGLLILLGLVVLILLFFETISGGGDNELSFELVIGLALLMSLFDGIPRDDIKSHDQEGRQAASPV
jgi:hypothetical protein